MKIGHDAKMFLLGLLLALVSIGMGIGSIVGRVLPFIFWK